MTIIHTRTEEIIDLFNLTQFDLQKQNKYMVGILLCFNLKNIKYHAIYLKLQTIIIVTIVVVKSKGKQKH